MAKKHDKKVRITKEFKWAPDGNNVKTFPVDTILTGEGATHALDMGCAVELTPDEGLAHAADGDAHATTIDTTDAAKLPLSDREQHLSGQPQPLPTVVTDEKGIVAQPENKAHLEAVGSAKGNEDSDPTNDDLNPTKGSAIDTDNRDNHGAAGGKDGAAGAKALEDEERENKSKGKAPKNKSR